MRTLKSVGVGILIPMFLVSCAEDSGSPDLEEQSLQAPATVAVTVSDSGFDMATDTLTSDPAELVVENSGDDKHSALISKLNEGVTPEDFTQGYEEGFPAYFLLGTLAGSAVELEPSSDHRAVVEFPPGEYAIFDPEAKKHEPGFFTVKESNENEAFELPEADYQVSEGEYFIEMPDEIEAGESTIELTNEGALGHELRISKVGTSEAPEAFAIAPPQSRAWVTIDLPPGKYEAVCTVPNFQDGKFKEVHVELGMKTRFVVR